MGVSPKGIVVPEAMVKVYELAGEADLLILTTLKLTPLALIELLAAVVPSNFTVPPLASNVPPVIDMPPEICNSPDVLTKSPFVLLKLPPISIVPVPPLKVPVL